MRRTRRFTATITAVLAVAGLTGLGAVTGEPGGAQVVSHQLTVTKTVTGDDPGVPFAMTVTCRATQVGSSDPLPTPVPGDSLELSGPGTTAAQAITLAGGGSRTLPVELPSNLEEVGSVSCKVTEDLAATTLPAGYSCTAPVIVPETRSDKTEPDTDGWAYFYDKGPGQDYTDSAVTIAVTNSCTKAPEPAPELAPTFTG